jgi:orotidine-5'-phosphate decarboxylase
MTYAELSSFIKKQQSFLCVGLDTDINKIPNHLKQEENPCLVFNKAIIDATAPYCVAFKPNTAFYEAMGIAGWQILFDTINYIKTNYPNHMVIADAKRGDIGNTSGMYAKAFFEQMGAHAVTVAPYMGSDSVKPFLAFKNNWTIVLGLTSNEGAIDFQLKGNPELYKQVIEEVSAWGTHENTMFVVGATKATMLAEIRNIIPQHFILVPGVGAQGGSLQDVAKYGMNNHCGLLVNASRSIIYAGSGADFALMAATEALTIQQEMALLLEQEL